MTNSTLNIMTAIFRDRDNAENAYQELLKRNFSREQISVLMSEETRARYSGTNTEIGNKAAQGTGYGAAVGGTVGAILGVIAAVGTSIAIPGLGLVIAGPIAAALAGAGAGGAAGGLIGALIGWGIPEETVKRYESGLKEGGIVLGFQPRNIAEADEVEKIWNDFKAEHIYR
jgi:uncharacterized membrane protein